MAVSDKEWEKAFDLLSKFERRLLDPDLFKWDYFTEELNRGKATLWRNKEFKQEFLRVKDLIKKYKNGADYSLEKSLESVKDSRIKELEQQVQELTNQLDRERERLAYASIIARRKNIDPNDFLEDSPLREAQNISKKSESNVQLADFIRSNKK